MILVDAHPLLPDAAGPIASAALAAAMLAGWVGVHRLGRRISPGPKRWAWRAGATTVGMAALLATADLLSRTVVLATSWPVWVVALIGAVTVEGVLALYALERRTVSRRVSLSLAAARLALVGGVLLMLAQPVISLDRTHELNRYVAVILDESASMRIADTGMSDADRVRLAELISADVPSRPHRLEKVADELRRMAGGMNDRAERLTTLTTLGERVADRFDALRAALGDFLSAETEQLDAHVAVLDRALKDRALVTGTAAGELTDARARVSVQARRRMDQARELLAGGGGDVAARIEELVDHLRRATGELHAAAERIDAAAARVDEAFFASLDEAGRQKVRAATELTRLELARRLLTGEDGTPGDGLLARLGPDYALRTYRLAGEAREAPLDEPAGPEGASAQATDLAAGLARVAADIPPERLAGVVLVSDGGHNASADPEPIARRIAAGGAPICVVPIGAARPPTDAAVVSVDAPDTLCAGDRLMLAAEIKLDGLAGREVRVSLLDGEREADFRLLTSEAVSLRRRVELTDTPETPGLRHYRVKVEPLDGEAIADNNARPVTVRVSDERTRVLLADGRARWEFRYLKNLFAARDTTVRLQYVLQHPDRIPGIPSPPAVAASASRPIDQTEATALPASEEEWAKFDVIILGDVAPEAMGPDDFRALEKFVAERGGALIVVAGSWHMPSAYAGTLMEDLLPATFASADGPVARSPDRRFAVALTGEGERSPITRLEVDPQANRRAWAELPPLHWRHGGLQARAGAVVLAYAVGPNPPEYLTDDPGTDPVERDRLRRRFQRRNALLLTQRVGMGRVMLLTFDRTWRLRYRRGDVYHHRLWAQVLRWATAGRLPAGTEQVRLGVDRARYSPDERVGVRVRLARSDRTPLTGADVAVTVRRDGRAVLRRTLTAGGGADGTYAAELGPLAPGQYAVRLECPQAEELLASAGVENVETRFAVEAAIPAELIELQSDAGRLRALAELTGGEALAPGELDRLVGRFGPGRLERRERMQWTIWDSWVLLIAILAVATTEWLIRKKAGLA